MKYSIKQDVVDSRGNRGTIVSVYPAEDGKVFYQVLFNKDWATGKADYVPEEYLYDLDSRQSLS